ncbi:putative membrane protein [Halobacteriovorax marinus SJ]|uniref:Membrane protein n=1 Tax=Halobacteriovorax marinus (strain ATCC BAA-682 / DSM 15412 / SJ) TaxID=862908 RepID=E1X600_HALMS|nr:hypothetical protein [Halobacteriovorax marinus]CBW27344.1 putative membrane protein [Halobacteriovorax marinus SJ]
MKKLSLISLFVLLQGANAEVIIPDLRPGSYELSQGLSSLSWTDRNAFRVSTQGDKNKNRDNNGTLNSDTYTSYQEGNLFYSTESFNLEIGLGIYDSDHEAYGSLSDYDTDFLAFSVHAAKKFNNFTLAAGIEKSDEDLHNTHSSANEQHRELSYSIAGSYNFNKNYYVGAQISKTTRKNELHASNITLETELDFYNYTLGIGHVSDDKNLTSELYLTKETDDKTDTDSKGSSLEIGSNIFYQVNRFLVDTAISHTSGKSYDKKTESKFFFLELNPEYAFSNYNFFAGVIANFGKGSSENTTSNTNNLDVKTREYGGEIGYRSETFESTLTMTSVKSENTYDNSPSSNNTDREHISKLDVIIKF